MYVREVSESQRDKESESHVSVCVCVCVKTWLLRCAHPASAPLESFAFTLSALLLSLSDVLNESCIFINQPVITNGNIRSAVWYACAGVRVCVCVYVCMCE